MAHRQAMRMDRSVEMARTDATVREERDAPGGSLRNLRTPAERRASPVAAAPALFRQEPLPRAELALDVDYPERPHTETEASGVRRDPQSRGLPSRAASHVRAQLR